jgi:hypothetical protein
MFKPETVQTFRFVSAIYDEQSQRAYLGYAFDHQHHFTEIIHFAKAPLLNAQAKSALQAVLKQLHLVAGISYYKAALPPKIQIETGAISQDNALFLQDLYQQGLGEFAYCNQRDLTDYIHFPCQADLKTVAIDYPLPQQTVVPVGGGKDSVVSIELLKQAGQKPWLLAVGQSPVIQNVMAVAQLPTILLQRQLSPQLFELNQQGAYNGHVPISAILAYIMAAAAIVYGFDTVVMSNERSANVGNVWWQQQSINHQYSKSLAFEHAVQMQFAQLLPSLRYFSLLRPLSELHIAALFARFPAYHAVFSSCNRNFAVQKKHNLQGLWCLACPKCRFVFLALAPWLPPDKLLAIFGRNLLADDQQKQGFAELLGLSGHKPFECVGEIEESQAALFLLSRQPFWAALPLVQQLTPQDDATPAKVGPLFTLSAQHLIPAEFQPVLSCTNLNLTF